MTLQQILFYRELGFELKQIKRILDRTDFETVTALQSHRKVLEQKLARTRTLIENIDKTIEHLKGSNGTKSEEMFARFSVAAGKDRFDEPVKLGGEANDCKLSAQDTDGAMCIFELTGRMGGLRHMHHDQDEWIYVVAGEFDFQVGTERFRAGAGESVFLPRKVAHVWPTASARPGTVINVYQPAGRMGNFFREVGRYEGRPQIHEVLTVDELSRLFGDHGMDLVGPPLVGEWKTDEGGRVIQSA